MILEKLTGKTYSELLSEKILRPLGMNNTAYTESRDAIANFATGYDMLSIKPVAQHYVDPSTFFSAGGMYSTAEDMQKWNEGLYTNKLISEKYKDIYFTPYKEKWACDWVVARNPFHNVADSVLATMRAGTLGRFMCFDIRFVHEKHSIVLMSNSRSSRMEEIQKNITAILFDKPYNLPKKSLHRFFIVVADKKGLDTAVSETVIAAKDTATYYISASEFLHTGYTYKYGEKDLRSAIRVFELMTKIFPETYNAYDTEFFPDSSNVYGVLGECYMENGQKDKALSSLKKAVSLNASDMHSAELIQKLEKQ
jgi:hypothetical protein